MTTVREHILSYFKSSIDAIPSLGAVAFRSRAAALARSEGSAIVIEPATDTGEQAVHTKLDWQLLVSVSTIVRGEIPDQVADPIIEKVHKKIMSDLTCGGYAYDVQPTSTSWNILDADNSAAVVVSNFLVLYRTELDDIAIG